jgi:hypothetical protein
MVRFILNRKHDDGHGATWEGYETLDIDVPELECALTRGGRGSGYDITQLVGVEIRESHD